MPYEVGINVLKREKLDLWSTITILEGLEDELRVATGKLPNEATQTRVMLVNFQNEIGARIFQLHEKMREVGISLARETEALDKARMQSRS